MSQDVVCEADLADLHDELEQARRRRRRHFIWAVVGFSPSAILPVVGIIAGGPVLLLGGLILALVGLEGVRAFRASQNVGRIKEAIALLESGFERPL